MAKMKVGIIGSGGRAVLHLKALLPLKDEFEICGMRFRTQEKADRFHKEWGIPVTTSVDELLSKKPDFVIVCTSYFNQDKLITQLMKAGVPVLAETPPASSMQGILDLWELSQQPNSPKILVAENCFEQPFWAAKIEAIKRGYLGDVNMATIGHTHEYHAFSVMRILLDEMNSPFTMVGKRMEYPLTLTHSHANVPILPGDPQYAADYLSKHMDLDFALTKDANGVEILDGNVHTAASYHAMVNFESGKTGFYDFTVAQFWSGIRSRFVLIRGTRGEIKDDQIKYIDKDHLSKTGVLQSNFTADGGLKNITLGDEILYENDLLSKGVGINPDISKMSLNMKRYLETGYAPYTFADALQDTYMTMLLHYEVGKRPFEVIHSQKMPWQK